ncbi:MAG: YqgE/AlgH family protein [Planctomycetota bacterium]
MSDASYFSGQFLIAMPGLKDPNFERCVTFLCQHSADGALGITINRPMELRVREVLEQLEIDPRDTGWADRNVLLGGPVHPDRGFVLHERVGSWDATIDVGEVLALTSSRDILEALAQGDGPDRAVLALGYAGWAPGQLEEEMLENAWLSGPANPELIFDTDMDSKWTVAAESLGIDITQLSSTAGHA